MLAGDVAFGSASFDCEVAIQYPPPQLRIPRSVSSPEPLLGGWFPQGQVANPGKAVDAWRPVKPFALASVWSRA